LRPKGIYLVIFIRDILRANKNWWTKYINFDQSTWL